MSPRSRSSARLRAAAAVVVVACLIPRAGLGDSLAGTWDGETPEGHIRADIRRDGRRLVGEIHLVLACLTLRMAARVAVRRSRVEVAAHRLGVVEVRCGEPPEPGAHALLRLSAPLPLDPMGHDWSIATPAVGGHTTPRGRFVVSSRFWMPSATVRMRRIAADAAPAAPATPLEPAVPERICPH